jgi:hypothetical protein
MALNPPAGCLVSISKKLFHSNIKTQYFMNIQARCHSCSFLSHKYSDTKYILLRPILVLQIFIRSVLKYNMRYR